MLPKTQDQNLFERYTENFNVKGINTADLPKAYNLFLFKARVTERISNPQILQLPSRRVVQNISHFIQLALRGFIAPE
jgi:hypothetical protein